MFIFSFIFLEIQCLGLSLIGCLVTKKNLCLGTGHLLAKILISSLQRFKDIGEVQIKVCAYLERNLRSCTNFSFRAAGVTPTLH